ncbi:MAG: hypothetical protein IT177_19465 [Acidobacteria bacterium]|nr:hypothetical protein [Acidobacteriota bacterium]
MTAIDRELRELSSLMQQLQSRPGLGSRPLGVPEWDWRLWRMGRECLAQGGASCPAAPEAGPGRVRDVYLATQLYDIGGHTALIGDFVRALGHESAHVIVTDLLGQNPTPVPEQIVSRLGLSSSQVTVVAGPSHAERLDQVLARLRALLPQRLFLFHHPHDPLASVVAQPEVAGERILVHHADAMPSFGLHVPGVRIVDLNPSAVALARALWRESWLLPLTSPDPGPRPHGFLRRGQLVTASSGSAHKFAGGYGMSYVATVAVILRATGGWHVHIGPLEDDVIAEARGLLAREGIAPDRFVYVRTVPCLAAALWEQDVDLYCASFPVDGARTKIEALSSATPYLRHAWRPLREPGNDPTLDAEGLLAWRTWDDLASTLRRLSDVAALARHSAHARRLYEQAHHPAVFGRTLARILDGREPVPEVPSTRLEAAMQSLLAAFASERIHDASPLGGLELLRESVGDLRDAVASSSGRLDGLDARHADGLRRLEDEIRALAEAVSTERRGQQARAEQVEAEGAALRRALTEMLADHGRRIPRIEHDLAGIHSAQAAGADDLRRELERLRAENDAWRSGRGLRAALRRWLMS